MRRVVLTVLVLAIGGSVLAGEFDLPPGKWWQDERLAERVGLTAEQRQQVDELVYRHAQRMIDLNANVKRAELELGNLVRQPQFDADRVRAAFASFQAARQALEGERFEMLLAVRAVLTTEQWETLQDLQQELRRRWFEERRTPPSDGPPRRGGSPPGPSDP